MSDTSGHHDDHAHSAGAGGDSYMVVARRYRPRGFDELVGQDQVARALKNAIETNRVGHAYLFTGARGVGKTSTARIFAKALNDPSGPTVAPDNSNDVARAIDSGEDIDVIEIDGASNRGIDEIRSLRANVGVRPSRSRFKIYIIDEVHMLTGAAFNALLKTLEEPPEHVKFIFCTTDPEKIPITVLSRCQRFDFAPVEVAKITTRLREIITAEAADADDDALELIARRASGSMRDSQSLLEQVLSFSVGKLTADDVHVMLGTADDERLHALARAMADRDAAEAIRQLDSAIDAGVDAGRFAEQLLGYFRDLMAVSVGCDASMLRFSSASLHSELKQLGAAWGLQTVLAVVGLIDQTLVRIRHSVHARVLLEATLIQICHLPDLQNIADLAAAAGSAAPAAKAATSKKKSEAVAASHVRTQPPDAQPQDARSTDARVSQNSGALQRPSSAPNSAASPPSSPPQPTSRLKTDRPSPMARGDTPGAVGEPGSHPVTTTAGSANVQVANVQVANVQVANVQVANVQTPSVQSTSGEPASGGQPIAVTDRAASTTPATRKSSLADRPSRMQRMREIEANPLIKSCIEIFDAEIVRIDKPR